MSIKILKGSIVPLLLEEGQTKFIIERLRLCGSFMERELADLNDDLFKDHKEAIDRCYELAEMIEEDMNARFNTEDTSYLEDCRDTVRDCLAAMPVH